MNYFLIPTYNESENIENLSRALSAYSSSSNTFFVFSDDGSQDNTVQLLTSYFEPVNTHIVLAEKNAGPGSAFNRGFEWILANGNDEDKIITMEADCTSDLAILPDMIAIHDLGYDLILASVYSQGGGFEKTTFIKKILSAIANFLFKVIFDLKVSTLSSFYRVYSINKLKEVKTRFGILIEETGFICMLELLLKMLDCKAKTIEVPMVLKSSNRVGKSKMKVLKTTLEYFRFLFRYKFNAKTHSGK